VQRRLTLAVFHGKTADDESLGGFCMSDFQAVLGEEVAFAF